MNAIFQNEVRATQFAGNNNRSGEFNEPAPDSVKHGDALQQPGPVRFGSIGMPSTPGSQSSVRQFRPLRFAAGFLCTTCGMAMILGVGFRAIEMRQLGEDAIMPIVAVCVIFGVMLVGGGFGIMATSSSGFDEAEFDRLAAAGNISAVSNSERDDIAHGDDSNHRDNNPDDSNLKENEDLSAA